MMSNLKMREFPDSEKPREKMVMQGIRSLSNSELLAILISTGTKNKSALDLAGEVLALEPGGLSQFSSYLPEEFMRVDGIGSAKACILTAAIELGRRISSAPRKNRSILDSSSAAADIFMEEMRYLTKEMLRVLMLNAKGELIMFEDISIGTVTSCSSSPRDVFSTALKKGAYAVIVAHNHPSGDPSPSREDISITKQLSDAGKILDIRLLDHIIIGNGRYFSFKEENML